MIAKIAENLIDCADLLFVLEIDGRVEHGHLLDGRLAHEILLARMRKLANFCKSNNSKFYSFNIRRRLPITVSGGPVSY